MGLIVFIFVLDLLLILSYATIIFSFGLYMYIMCFLSLFY